MDRKAWGWAPVGACVLVSAAQAAPRQADVSLLGGAQLGGEITPSGYTFETDAGLMLSAQGSVPVTENMALGGYIFYADQPTPKEDIGGDVGSRDCDDCATSVFSVGVSAETNLVETEVFRLRPGLVLGWNFYSFSIGGDDFSGSGVNLGADVEAIYDLGERFGVVADVGFYSTLFGSHDGSHETRHGDDGFLHVPIFFVAVGPQLRL